MKNKFKLLGIIVLITLVGFSIAACDSGGDSSGGSGNENPSGSSKTIVGVWTKSVEGQTGLLTIKSDNTWNVKVDGELWEIDGTTWDSNGLKFFYDYPGNPNPRYLTIPYSLSADGNSLTLLGENAQLLGGSSPWARVE